MKLTKRHWTGGMILTRIGDRIDDADQEILDSVNDAN